MRSEWCRQHIKETAKNCGLQKSVVNECEQASSFVNEHSAFAECGSRAIVTLIREKDNSVRERAISLAEKALKVTTPTGGKKKTRLSEREIKRFIERADREVHKESIDKSSKDREMNQSTTTNATPSQTPDLTSSHNDDPIKQNKKIQGEVTKKDKHEKGNQNPPTAPIATILCEKPGDQHRTENVEPAPTPGPVGSDGQNGNTPVAAAPLPVLDDTYEWSPDTCKGGSCPDGKKHYVKHPSRNRMECDILDVEITQLPHDDCPVLIQRRNEAAAKSTTATVPAAPVSDAKPEVVEQQQASATTTTQPEPLTFNDKKALAERFKSECLSPVHAGILDDFVDSWGCKTCSGAIEHLIDLFFEEPVKADAQVVQPDDKIKHSQEDGGTRSPKSNKRWMFPKGPLSDDEWVQIYAEFVQLACTSDQKRMIEALIADGKFTNEMAVLDFALEIVGELVTAANRFHLPTNQSPTIPIIRKYSLEPLLFEPFFTVRQPEATKYPGMSPQVSVKAVFLDVVYSLNQRGGAMAMH
jgi:hypothetical protein